MSERAEADASGAATDSRGEVDGPDSKDESEGRTERTTVRTYVPRYQKEQWADQAEELDMSLSEFVRTMTQAGRRGFGGDAANETHGASDQPADQPADQTAGETPDEEPGSEHATPGVEGVETVLLDALREEPRTYDDLVDVALGDVRESVADEVGDALQELQASNDVTHDPRAGRYTLTGE